MVKPVKRFPVHGWIGLGLVTVFWTLNWTLDGLRTQWAFFPLWLGYCLTIDALVFWRTGTSLFVRNWKKYIGLFIASAPVWWLFELANWRLQNWHYDGAEAFSTLQFWFWATINFTTVIPAVFGSAELMRSFLTKPVKGPTIRPTKTTTIGFFLAGWAMLALMVTWPRIFFPFLWISLYFILEPVNIWLSHRSPRPARDSGLYTGTGTTSPRPARDSGLYAGTGTASPRPARDSGLYAGTGTTSPRAGTGTTSLVEWTKDGNWQPVVTLWLGVLLTAFFWEMWNFLSYPKWVYHVAWGNWFHIFEMPLLGYGGYLPFALELFAMYHLLAGLSGSKKTDYVMKPPEA